MDNDKKIRRRNLAAVNAFSLLMQIAQLGFLPPLLGLILQQNGMPPAQIGAVAAAPWVAILAASRFVPAVIARVGLAQTGALGVVVAAAAIGAMAVFHGDFWTLLILNFIAGAGLILRWLACDIWIVRLAHKTGRGRAIGVHETISGLGIATGPLLLAAVGVGGLLPFAVMIALLALAALPLATAWQSAGDLRDSDNGDDGESADKDGNRWRPLLILIPGALAGAVVCGFIETISISLLPAYAAGLGMPAAAAILLVGAFGAGNTILQFPLGWLADAVGCYRAQIIAAIIALAGAAILPPLLGASGVFAWILMFFWGGAAGGMYTLAVMEAGEKTDGARLGAAMSAVAFTYTIGGVAGPIISGIAMETAKHGFMLAAGGAAALFLIAATTAALKKLTDRTI